MLCKQCKNNQICKHFEYFKSINSNISLSINSCDYNNNPNAIQYTGFPTSKGSSTFSVDIDKPTPLDAPVITIFFLKNSL